jgi:hypothetical protein
LSRTRSTRSVVIIVLAILAGSVLTILPLPAVAASPTCGSILTTSAILTSNIGPCSGNGIDIQGSNLVLNCKGHTISGTGTIFDTGLQVDGGAVPGGIHNVLVMNCVVTGFYFEMGVGSASDSIIKNNVVTATTGYPLRIGQDSKDIFIGNRAYGGSGIPIDASNGNLFIGNSVVGAYYNGFWSVDGSQGNLFIGNLAKNNGVFGFLDSSTGTGTAGTANTYLLNLCPNNFSGGSSPPGLCNP